MKAIEGVEMNLSRMNIIKWLLEKLLTSFVASVIVYFAPMIGLNLQKIGFGYVYTIVNYLPTSRVVFL